VPHTCDANESLSVCLFAAVSGELTRALQRSGLVPRKKGGLDLDPERHPDPYFYKLEMMSRTDAQVHATRNVFGFAANATVPLDLHPSGHCPQLVNMLNRHLPTDIRVLSASRLPSGCPSRTDILSRTYEMHVPLASLMPDPAFAASLQWQRLSSLNTPLNEDHHPHDGRSPLGRFREWRPTPDEAAAVSRFREALRQLEGSWDWGNFTERATRSHGVKWRFHPLKGFEDEWLRFPPSYYQRMRDDGPLVASEESSSEDGSDDEGGEIRRDARPRRVTRHDRELKNRLRNQGSRQLPDPTPWRDSTGKLVNHHDNWRDWPSDAFRQGTGGWTTAKPLRRVVWRCDADDPVCFVSDSASSDASASDALEVPPGGWRVAQRTGYETVPLRLLRLPDSKDLHSLPQKVGLPTVRVCIEGASFILHQIRSMVGLAAWAAKSGTITPKFWLDLPRAPVIPLAPGSTLILRDMEFHASLPLLMQPRPPFSPPSELPPAFQSRSLQEHWNNVARGSQGLAETDIVSPKLRAAVSLLPQRAHLLSDAALLQEAEFFRNVLQPRLVAMSNAMLLASRFRAFQEAVSHRGRVLSRWSDMLASDPTELHRVTSRECVVTDRSVSMPPDERSEPTDAAVTVRDAASLLIAAPPRSASDSLDNFLQRNAARTDTLSGPPPPPEDRHSPEAPRPSSTAQALPRANIPAVPPERMTSILETALCVANDAESLARVQNVRKLRMLFPHWTFTLQDLHSDDTALLRELHGMWVQGSLGRFREVAQRKWDRQLLAATEAFGEEAIRAMLDARGTETVVFERQGNDGRRFGGARMEVGHRPEQVAMAPHVAPAAIARAADPTRRDSIKASLLIPNNLSAALRMELRLDGIHLAAVSRAVGLRVLRGEWPLLAPTETYLSLVEQVTTDTLAAEGIIASVSDAARAFAATDERLVHHLGAFQEDHVNDDDDDDEAASSSC
jgi:tRNA U38,U39,U40 pseudouridine synthase TruA